MIKGFYKFIGKHKKKLFFILFLSSASYFFFFKKKVRHLRLEDLDLEEIKVVNIKKVVAATGTINPSDIIMVGSQISGKIEKVLVDYNSIVKKDQKLAIIDTTILKRDIQQTLSVVNQEKSRLKTVELNYRRAKELYKNNYISRMEMEQSDNEYVQAKENHRIALVRYNNAKTQLGYAYIVSPIDGVIISREIDEGQTVAASFSAPTLFKIAKDLTKMKIETSVSEADISLIKEGKEIEFTVDAYRNKTFTGKIKQIRYNPFVEQNVVIYNVIIEIENEELLLLPGMTAYVSITIDSVDNVLGVVNTALRFKPSKEVRTILGLKEMAKEDVEKVKTILKDKSKTVIYVYENGKVQPMIIEKGLSDTMNTELRGEQLRAGMKVISVYLGKTANKD